MNWLHFVKTDSRPEWMCPTINIPYSIMDKFDCNKYILGEPGSGKTTLLRTLAQEVGKCSESILPVYLPLVVVKESTMNALIEGCIDQLEMHGYAFTKKNGKRDFLSQLSAGRFQLFLDGIDECGSNAKRLMEVIGDLAKDYPNCRIIVSCKSTFRGIGFKGAMDLLLKPFSKDQLNQFIKKWFGSQPSSLQEISRWIEQNPKMGKAATNPLVASLLCSLFESGADMPSAEIELYERRFELLLGKWDRAKGIQRLPGDLMRRYWKFIMELAFEMHQHELRMISITEASRTAERFYSRKYHRDPEKMVIDCVHRGILQFEPSEGLSFGHLIYQEYLAARRPTKVDDPKLILRNIRNVWWTNTIRLYASAKEDLGTLVQYAIDTECKYEEAVMIIRLAERIGWTEEILLEELRDHADKREGQIETAPYSKDLWEELLSRSEVAVGTALAGRPPHRSVLEELPHTALASGSNAKAN